MKFAWVLHPFEPTFHRDYGFRFGALAWLWAHAPAIRRGAVRRQVVMPFCRMPQLTALDGSSATGRGFLVPMAPSHILTEQARALNLVWRACERAQAWGADVIGLAELTGLIGGRGTKIAGRASATITTGCAYTVWTSIEVYEHAMERMQRDPWASRVTVLGLPDNRALGTARLLAIRGVRLTLVGDAEAPWMRRCITGDFAAAPGNVEFIPDLDAALRRNRVIFAASTTGRTIDTGRLAPGTIVVDIGQPWDVIRPPRHREDLLILDGGVVSLPATAQGKLPWFPRNYINACLAESAISALSGGRRTFSLGRDLRVSDIEAVGHLARLKGFSGRHLFSRYRPVAAERVRQFRPYFAPVG
jgi:predicted amino acid dehydrogenase